LQEIEKFVQKRFFDENSVFKANNFESLWGNDSFFIYIKYSLGYSEMNLI